MPHFLVYHQQCLFIILRTKRCQPCCCLVCKIADKPWCGRNSGRNGSSRRNASGNGGGNGRNGGFRRNNGGNGLNGGRNGGGNSVIGTVVIEETVVGTAVGTAVGTVVGMAVMEETVVRMVVGIVGGAAVVEEMVVFFL